MSIETRRHIARINAARWDAAVEGRPFASHAWMAFGERVHTADRPVYQIVRNRSRDESASVAWVRRAEQLPIANRAVRSLIAGVLRSRPLVTCQTAVSPHSGLFAGAGASGLAHLSSGLKRILNDVSGSFLVVPYLEPDLAASPAWGRGFLSAALSPNTYLPLRWSSFGDYIDGLRRSVRKDYRRARNQALRLGLRTEVRLKAPEEEAIRPLIRSVERRYGAAPAPWQEALIRARPVPGGKWILVLHGEVIVGCGLMLRDRRFVTLTLLGVAEGAKYVYIRLMYGAIRHAIETGAVGIFGGGGTYGFKARLGFHRTTNTRTLFYARDPRLRKIGAWLARRESGAVLGLLIQGVPG